MTTVKTTGDDSELVRIRVNARERAEIERRAQARGLTIEEWIQEQVRDALGAG